MNTKTAIGRAALLSAMMAALAFAFSVSAAVLPRDEAGPAAEMPAAVFMRISN